jgi:hypothetical protein
VNEDNPTVAAGGHRDGGWDVRVRFVQRRQRWWWNAWRATTSTELYGFADSRTDAWSAMNQAINTAQVPDQLPARRARPCSGAA